MRIVDFAATAGREIDRFDSVGATVAPLLRSNAGAQVVRIRLEPGGVLGRHDASVTQLFAVVEGEGTVSGGDGEAQPIRAGQAAVWEAGESHETRTETGLTALVVEGEALDVLAAGSA